MLKTGADGAPHHVDPQRNAARNWRRDETLIMPATGPAQIRLVNLERELARAGFGAPDWKWIE